MPSTTDATNQLPLGSRTELGKRRRTERRTELGNRRRTELDKCHAAAEDNVEPLLARTYDTGFQRMQVTAAAGKVEGVPLPIVEVEREESDTESDIEALTKFMAAIEALDDAVSSSWRSRWR